MMLRGKRLGFSLAKIREYLDLYDADPTHKSQLGLLLAQCPRRIEALERQRRDLGTTLGELRDRWRHKSRPRMARRPRAKTRIHQRKAQRAQPNGEEMRHEKRRDRGLSPLPFHSPIRAS